MRTGKYQDGIFLMYPTLSEALEPDFHLGEVISAVGAGGKTAILERLAEERSGHGRRILMTTTTHIALPREGVFFSDNPDEIKNCLNTMSLAVAGRRCGSGKLEGLPEDVYEDLCRAADMILVEADGSHGRPLKAPAAHEPCIPRNTTHLLILAGLDSIGYEVDEVCHRPEEIRRILKTSGTHRISPSDVAVILNNGYLEPYGKTRTAYIILNKADCLMNLDAAAEIAECLRPVPVLVTGRSVPPNGTDL